MAGSSPMNALRRDTLLLAVTSPLSWTFYRGLITHLREAGFEPVLLSSPGPGLQSASEQEGVASVAVPMEREIAPLKDLVSLWKLYRAIRRIRPSIVDAGTPKAGLLVGIAAWLARVPCRVYSLHGLRMETAVGLKRKLLCWTERIAGSCSHQVFCLSPSLRNRAVTFNLVSPENTVLVKNGGFGVNLEQFAPCAVPASAVEDLRHRLGIPGGAPVIGFVGRFVKDKGIQQLLEAFDRLRRVSPELRLLMVGDFEDGDRVKPELRHYIENTPAIVRPGFVSDPAPYFRLMDVLVLPTHREGFGQVSAEAQASGIPVVTTNATGAVDSVIDGVTGIIVPVGDSEALSDAIGRLLVDPELRSRMGGAGRKWMERDFCPKVIWDHRVQLYRELVAQTSVAARTTRNHAKAGMSVESETASRTITDSEVGKEEHATARSFVEPEHERRNKTTGSIGPPPRSYMRVPHLNVIGRCMKRLLDFSVATCALVILSPVLLLVALLVRVSLGAPILFRQDRPGLKGKVFTCIKFRTMTNASNASGELLPDSQRLTPLGRFLRNTSIDELPGLINVVRGEMSLVGPRPLLPQYLKRYTPEQMRRHEVKPGITGWVQINGRNALEWDQKFALDLWYVEHQSFWLDLRILATTAWRVFKRNGIAQAGHVTMPEFLGVSGREKGNPVHSKRIVIIGAGGAAREIASALRSINRTEPQFEFLGYVVSDLSRLQPRDSRDQVLGDFGWLRANRHSFDALAMGIGTPAIRLKLTAELRRMLPDIAWPAIIHPTAIIELESARIAEGSFIGAGVTATVNITLDPFALCNFGCTLGHEARIGPGSVVNPGANISGGVVIGTGVLVGTGAQILQYLHIGDGATVGAGAVVTRDVAEGLTVLGVPARPRALGELQSSVQHEQYQTHF
jgi:sugar O-acyltransferase (sialic acid O-acetyltransferase NeuD family)